MKRGMVVCLAAVLVLGLLPVRASAVELDLSAKAPC